MIVNDPEAKKLEVIDIQMTSAAFDVLMAVDEDRRVMRANPSAELLFDGVDPVGKLLADLPYGMGLDALVEDAMINLDDSYEEQLTINERIYRLRAQSTRYDGVIYVGIALQDVTQLVRLNRARRDMVANISHELRTPIANIQSIIEKLFDETEKPKRKRSIASLHEIREETEQLLWLVQELHDLSMIESGQAIMRLIEVPLYEIVQESVERLTDQAAKKDIKLLNKVSDETMVLCDRDQLRRVLINLVHNAIKWSPRDAKVLIQANEDDEDVVVSVYDEGPGVPDDQVERIFERFYQVDASRSGNEGSGLGLAICKHIVSAHEGRIWAEPGSTARGGHFLFTLLRAEERPTEMV